MVKYSYDYFYHFIFYINFFAFCRKKNYIIKKKSKNALMSKFIKKNFLKVIEVNKLNINVKYGSILNIIVVPVFCTLLEFVKAIPFKKLNEYKYVVMPEFEYNCLKIKLDAIICFRIIDVLKLSLKNYKLVKIHI